MSLESTSMVERCLRLFGFKEKSNDRVVHRRYISAKETVNAAKAKGQTVCEYVRWLEYPDRYVVVLPGNHVKSFFHVAPQGVWDPTSPYY